MSKIKITPAILARRILRDMKAFVPVDGVPVPEYLAELCAIPTGQTILGVYENTIGSRQDAVIVTDLGLWVVRESGAEEIRYEDVESVMWDPEGKRAANAVRLGLKGSRTALVPVRGRLDNGADVFEFVRFLTRASGSPAQNS